MTEINVNLKLSVTDENGNAIITSTQGAELSNKVYALLSCALDQLLINCPCNEAPPCPPVSICDGLELIVGSLGTSGTGLYPFLGIVPISTNTPVDGLINILVELGETVTSQDVIEVVDLGGYPGIRVIKDTTVDYSTLKIVSMPKLLGTPGALNNDFLGEGKYRVLSVLDEGTAYHANGTWLLSLEEFNFNNITFTPGAFNYSNFAGLMFLDVDNIDSTKNLNATFSNGVINFNTSSEAINIAKIAKITFTLNATGCDTPLVKTFNGLTGEVL